MTAKRIQNPKRLTPAEKGKAKVNEYEEFPAEIQQKIPQRIEFLNPEHTNSIILEEVLQTSAKFLGDNSTNYPIHIQILLDNLTRAFIKKHKNLHEKSIKALEYHLVCNEILLQSIASPNDQPVAKIINRARSPTEIYQIQRISPKEMGKV
jgi:flagellar motor switch protein FliG